MSDPTATLSLPTKERNKMDKQICTLEIVIEGTPYYYEAHSYQRVAEILHGQIETLNALNEKYPQTYGKRTIDSFTIHHFQ